MEGVTKQEVKEFLERERDDYGLDLMQFPQEALVFSFLLGMSPEYCVGMCPEEDMDRETLELYDKVDSFIWELKRDWRR